MLRHFDFNVRFTDDDVVVVVRVDLVEEELVVVRVVDDVVVVVVQGPVATNYTHVSARACVGQRGSAWVSMGQHGGQHGGRRARACGMPPMPLVGQQCPH